jgi:hypothetical protein
LFKISKFLKIKLWLISFFFSVVLQEVCHDV